MAEIGEGVALLVELMEQPQKCGYEPPQTQWRCKLDGDSGSLTQNLKDHCGIVQPVTPASVNDVTPRRWPSQAHHLIPWQQLRKHPVTQWLAESPPKAAGKVLKDNDYSVDHGKNGKFMPYASSLAEWPSANTDMRRKLSETVMAAAGIQLHQGPHSYKSYGVGEDGYKSRVAEYLQRIHESAIDHAWVDDGGKAVILCEECHAKSRNGKVPPRRNVVDFMDMASTRLEVDINTARVFVSRRAAAFVASGGVTY